MTDFGVYPEPALIGPPLLAVWTVVVVRLARAGRWTDLAIGMVLVGLVQWPLIAFSGSLLLQATADAAVLALLLGTLVVKVRHVPRPWLVAGAVLVLVVLVQATRASDAGAALQVVRQVLVPLCLAATGVLLRGDVDWPRLGRVVAGLGMAVSVYMLLEKAFGRPLVPVSDAYMAATGDTEASLRLGQPSAYYADGITEQPWFRPGGPFFNPPISGIFVGASVYAALRWLPARLAWPAAGLGAAAVVLSVARAGIVMVLAVCVLPLLLRYLGRVVTTVFGVAAAAGAALLFSGQGGTISHAEALVNGVRFAVTHPLGSGFGTQGYFARTSGLEGVEVNESWLGVVFASVGLLAVLAAVGVLVAIALLIWQAPRGRALPPVLLLTAFAVTALSESAGAVRGTTALWLFVGEATATAVMSVRAAARARDADPGSPLERAIALVERSSVLVEDRRG